MSYPEARYHGAGGELSATFRPATAPPELERPPDITVDYLATGATTEGLFGLFRWNMGAAAGGPRPHFHRTFAESFYVLIGRVKIFDGRQWRDAGPGDFVHVPVGGVHAFRNESGADASMLILFAPGAPRETYFESPRPADDELEAFFVAHDQYHV